MAKTSLEVIAEAHRRLNVLSVDEDPSEDMISYGGTVLDAALAEETVTFTRDEVPDSAYRALAWLMAADMAVHYERPAEGRGRALTRLHAALYPDDRTDRRDFDGDGQVSDAEAQAAQRAEFY